MKIVMALVLAHEWFVAPTGDDAAPGTVDAPLRTLAKALDRAKDGDTVTLRAGTFAGNVRISRSDLTVRSFRGERAVIRAERGTNVLILHRKGVTLRNLVIEGGTGYGVDFDRSPHGLLEGCRVHGVKGEIVKVSPGSHHVTIRDCEIFDNRGAAAEGIDCVSADDLTVQDTTIHDIGSNGAYAKGGARRSVFERCLFMRCGLNPGTYGAGVLLGQAGGEANNPNTPKWQNVDGVVRNCVFIDILGAGMGATSAVRPRFYNNTLLNVAKKDRAAIILIGSRDLPCSGAEFVNNVVVGDPDARRHLFWIYPEAHRGPITADHNRWFGGSGRFWDNRKGGGVHAFDAWRERLGVGAGSSFGDPMLDSSGRLRTGSPCVDAGRILEGAAFDIDGEERGGRWDIGADELGGAAPESDYAEAMKKVARRFKGKAGVVLHFGDSITYANPYGQWARFGKGKTEKDKAVCRWMHVNKRDDTDGWHLCSVDRPGGRSETAASGIRSDQFLKGGKSGMAPLGALVKKYNPQMAVVMLGTNDASAGRSVEAFTADMTKIIDLLLANGAIPIVSTVPPHFRKEDLAREYNEALRKLAAGKKVPLIDYYEEIVKRRAKDWNGTLMGKNDVHPSARHGGTGPSSEPTEQNLKNSGYLLRGWLSVRKIAEVKERVLDGR